MKETRNIADVAVLISTYNWPEALMLSVRSVFNQTVLPKEIVIADDGSGQETAEAVAQLKSELPDGVDLFHAWHQDKGFRAAAIRNKALSFLSAPYVVQIDGDCIMERHFVEDHLYMRRPGYFIAGSRVVLNQKDTAEIVSSLNFDESKLSLSFGHFLNAKRNRFLSGFLATRYKKNNLWAARGANMSYYLEDIKKVNGYNEAFVGWGFEDSELVFRMYNSGLKHLTLKFSGVLYHLYHNERKRDKADEYRALALKVLHDGIKRTDPGLDTCWERD